MLVAIVRNGKRVRGYPHVALVQVTQTDDDQSVDIPNDDQATYEQGEF
jgi:hypothetical protein